MNYEFGFAHIYFIRSHVVCLVWFMFMFAKLIVPSEAGAMSDSIWRDVVAAHFRKSISCFKSTRLLPSLMMLMMMLMMMMVMVVVMVVVVVAVVGDGDGGDSGGDGDDHGWAFVVDVFDEECVQTTKVLSRGQLLAQTVRFECVAFCQLSSPC